MNTTYTPSFKVSERVAEISSRARQRGVSLFVALVALVLMTIAGFSLMRSVDTGNVIAGNMAFREVTVHSADLGIEAAAAYLNATVAPSPDGNLPNGCNVAASWELTLPPPPEGEQLGECRYFARIQPEYSNGVPKINWASGNIPTTAANGVAYQYVVERLCNPDTAVDVTLGQAAKNDIASERCATRVIQSGGSHKPGPPSVSPIVPVKYRVTVRVTGPRNSISTVQTIMER